MLVSFLGSPVSGKTTIAAKVFAELKESGQPNVEFVAEQARIHIAYLKLTRKSLEPFKLTDVDQLDILHAQWNLESLLTKATGSDGVVVSDSSVLNSLWYMTPEGRAELIDDGTLEEVLDFYKDHLIFLSNPIHILGVGDDLLRVHSLRESHQIHDSIVQLLQTPNFQPIANKVVSLNGPINVRVNEVVRAIYKKLGE